MGRTTRRLRSTLSIPTETLLLIHDLQSALTEDEKKSIRVALLDVMRKSECAEERDAISEALIDD